MMLIRMACPDDLDALVALARLADVGVTSLQADPVQLAERIERSQRSLRNELERADQGYLFVLECSETGTLAGTCSIESALGLRSPWYNYRVGKVIHASPALNIYSSAETLFLSNDHTGSSEVCALFLHPDWRRDHNGGLLSKCRFLFMAQHPERFASKVIAEMRGVSDEQGCSPFWEALGRHFFTVDFAQADHLTGVGHKSVVAELMPKYPVYLDLLPAQARAVVGEVHEKTRPALAMLQEEGFRYEGYVDIFDAGPTIEAYLHEIRAVRQSRLWTVSEQAAVDAVVGEPWLIATTGLNDFRMVLHTLNAPQGSLPLDEATAQLLGVRCGDVVRAVPLHPPQDLSQVLP